MDDVSFERADGCSAPVAGRVAVWRLRLVPGAEEILEDEERARLAGYASAEARGVFLAGRAGVRLVAGRYSGLAPEAVRMGCDERGKPFFEAPRDLHFNLSHSGGAVMAAFSRVPVGLDIERRGRSRDFQAIARRFFLPAESAAVLEAGSSREDVFLRIWTAKEAIVKLSGDGLGTGLALVGTAPDGQGFLGDRRIYLRRFFSDGCIGTVASFSPFEVKDWFDL